MDKGAIRKFAVTARNKLMESVAQKAFELGITKDAIKEAEIYQDGFMINQNFYKKYEIKQREKLVREIERKGFDQVIEEVAYTWFNRFIALRFMEVNDYLPTGIRIFSSIEPGKTEPDALTEVLMLVDELNLEEQKVYELQDANDEEDLFKYILVRQCNKLGEMMPMMFEEIQDYTELLIPNQLLAENSVIHDMVTIIDEADWTEEVEIIGWLYQYYISEKKDQVFADLKKNTKITKENIPAATELFTPRWIVQYMVDNSLGRLWLESHPDNKLQETLPYYLEVAEQPENVVEQLNALKDNQLKPESIKFLDPCMGSGHILVYAFEVLYEIYKSEGYREQAIPKLIIENNLYGLDIDPRAAQLAYFSVMMKARSYSSRVFGSHLDINLHGMEESNVITEEDIELFTGSKELSDDLEMLMDTFKDGKLYGSIIEVPEIDLIALKEQALDLKENDETNDMFAMDFKENTLPILERIIDQAIILSEEYDVVVTNPPYMGRKGMNAELGEYVKKNYKDSSADLYAVFMEVASQSVKENGFIGLINQHSWMFLSSFEKLRKSMLKENQLYSMAHLGTRAFAEIGGEVVQTTSFVMRKNVISDYMATFVRLVDYNNAEEKSKQFYNKSLHYDRTQDAFSDIPGSPVAYWASERARDVFKNSMELREIAEPRQGLATGDNRRFLRQWFEIPIKQIGFHCPNTVSAHESKKRWFPHNKGGTYRKWYGNNDYIILFNKENFDILKLQGNKLPSRELYFKEGITWSRTGSNLLSVRKHVKGSVFDCEGCFLKTEDKNVNTIIMAYLNSVVAHVFLKKINPTLHFQVGDIRKIPVIKNYDETLILKMANQCVIICRSDWDSFETSWDFKTHPLIEFKKDATKLSDAFSNWQQEAEHRFQTLKANEEELNRIFIDLYGLQDELTPEVEDKEITVSRADQVRDVKSFLSYAVGLMFGRYSLDEEGLSFAGGTFSMDKYETFKPDADNVIPIADDVYFEDDIISRLITIIQTIYGQEGLEENMDFIADTLTKKATETARQRIRRYFLKEFYKDHMQRYQKRPIYWLFDSGKQDGFKALVYLHRYDSGLAARVRTDYLHAQQKKYEQEMERQNHTIESDVSKQAKTKAKKRIEKLQKQLLECQSYDQVIGHIAHQRIELDLDDGVTVNYAKFQDVEVPLGEGKKPLKANVLAKI